MKDIFPFINKVFLIDFLRGIKFIPDESVHCVVTSPPYWNLRNYGDEVKSHFPSITFSLYGMPVTVPEWTGQLGLEPDPMMFTGHMVHVFRQVKRVLRKDGTLWLNLGDSYSSTGKNRTHEQVTQKSTLQGGKKSNLQSAKQPKKEAEFLKRKDLCGIPWMVAFALRDDGWYLRQDVIWSKRNCLPESVNDRCTKSHEYVFLLSKSPKYYFHAEAIKQPVKDSTIEREGRNRSENHKMVNGAPGQVSHSLHKPKYAWGRAIDGSIDDNRNGSGDEIRISKSGNKKRKPASERGVPEGTGKNQCASVPWEGAMANKRSVWDVPAKSFKDAHFATYPPELITDMIKAGCPDHVCKYCGTPYIEKYDNVLVPVYGASKNSIIDNRDIEADLKDQGSNRQKDGHKPGHSYISTLVAYEKNCDCQWGQVPGVVLEPFDGGRTTSITSRKLNKSCISFEMNPEYIQIGDKREYKELGLFK